MCCFYSYAQYFHSSGGVTSLEMFYGYDFFYAVEQEYGSFVCFYVCGFWFHDIFVSGLVPASMYSNMTEGLSMSDITTISTT